MITIEPNSMLRKVVKWKKWANRKLLANFYQPVLAHSPIFYPPVNPLANVLPLQYFSTWYMVSSYDYTHIDVLKLIGKLCIVH